MHINPHLFILPRTPGQIVWNYKEHVQHELDLNYATRLAQLIDNPDLFDPHNTIDIQLLNADILTIKKQTALPGAGMNYRKFITSAQKTFPANIPHRTFTSGPDNILGIAMKY